MEEHEVAMYSRLARAHRGTPQQVGAGSERSQEVRFEVILELLDAMLGERLAGMSILDFGCGRGDLATFLDRRGRLDGLRYIGVDGIAENVEDGRRATGGDFRLLRWNGEGRVVEDEIDLVVFSGAFATTRMDRRIAMLRSLLAQARVGVVGNFLTWTPAVDDFRGMILMEPEEALRAVDRSEFRVRLRADYLPHDFTIAAIRWSFDP
jgi:SAM-dependent methyltransferase